MEEFRTKQIGGDLSAGPRAGRPSVPVLTWFRLARVVQKVDQLTTEHLRAWRLSIAQFDMLAQVGRAEGLTQQQLAQALLVTKGNVCQLVDRMEHDGLIRRCHRGRSNQLYLTEAGRQLYAEVIPAQEALLARLFSSLDETETRQLATLLRTFSHSLRNATAQGEQHNEHPDCTADHHLDDR